MASSTFQIGDRVCIVPGFVDAIDIGKEGAVVRAGDNPLYPLHVLLDGQEVAWPIYDHEIEKVATLPAAA